MGDKLGVKRSTIANYETDNRLINLDDLLRLATFFNVGLDFFGVVENQSKVFDLISRARLLFESDKLTDNEKEQLHYELLKVYLEITAQK